MQVKSGWRISREPFVRSDRRVIVTCQKELRCKNGLTEVVVAWNKSPLLYFNAIMNEVKESSAFFWIEIRSICVVD